jgi:hypothetical protein
MSEDITHKEIYDRLCLVEGKIDNIDSSTKDIIAAFNNAQGAFKVLEWIAKVLATLAAIAAAVGVFAGAINILGKK